MEISAMFDICRYDTVFLLSGADLTDVATSVNVHVHSITISDILIVLLKFSLCYLLKIAIIIN